MRTSGVVYAAKSTGGHLAGTSRAEGVASNGKAITEMGCCCGGGGVIPRAGFVWKERIFRLVFETEKLFYIRKMVMGSHLIRKY